MLFSGKSSGNLLTIPKIKLNLSSACLKYRPLASFGNGRWYSIYVVILFDT